MTMTITLNYPFEHQGKTINELQMRRPKLKDQLRILDMKLSEVKGELHMFANLCEQPPDVITELDMADYQQLQNAYKDFLASTPVQSSN
ncbi:phage tail assembly protein [Pseudoalteromonas luteoviolacea]|uniref:phage tail assembly protein n=1 Tax=Pseudoalteromonas luteoviolacea TaxID=43657 RepID=UPI0011547BAA|nr:phage tail assembly protein [Pseudoalteromonas luteoviolacea]TQF69539.1 phage tail assembly protein [Pseudoalteromonas luteoviolacea]